ncbi:hypothetical protein CAPNMURICA_51 [Arthrobacter phage CapnMurica]|uniref:Uncharacterized protein n=1 Tax=Arthrobacter phage CapnMurica TaxID=1772294 RepID=A0A0U4JQ53_9CAUD|nr:hypothetical protein FDH68_gp51 [Arthrobacter phage CaptnMurica]ALY08651.1 hypothetical protein CAPNMURICA_51 [Arthrobacter phage CaptnMurica]
MWLMQYLRNRSRRKHCAHTVVRGIYGDLINHTPGFRRLQCEECLTYLDGPVSLSLIRRKECLKWQPPQPSRLKTRSVPRVLRYATLRFVSMKVSRLFRSSSTHVPLAEKNEHR